MAVGHAGLTGGESAPEPEPGSTRVERTGIALVHEGEYIVPAAGARAGLSQPGTVVNHYFPVEIEVVGELGEQVVRRVAEHVFAALDRELSSRL